MLAYKAARRPYKKIQGGQKIDWISTIHKHFKELNTELTNAERIAHDNDANSQQVSWEAALCKRSDLGSQKSGLMNIDDKDMLHTRSGQVIIGT